MKPPYFPYRGVIAFALISLGPFSIMETAMAQADTPPTDPARAQAGDPMRTDDERMDAPELRSTLDDQRSVAVTIYNDDLALVKDRRRVSLPVSPPDGRVALAFRDVSARIRPETALLRDIDGGGLTVIEQNFDFDLLTPAKLLEKYVGREVGLVSTHPTTGEQTEEPATVLAATNGVVLRIGDRIETGGFAVGAGGQPVGQPVGLGGRIVYRDIPSNLRDRPTLVLTLDRSQPPSPDARTLDRTLELSYLTGGLSWQADYVGELGPDETRLDLTGWVTLENRSGTRYRNARLQLVAGDVHQVQEQMPMMRMEDAPRAMAAAPPPMAEESLFEYHLYTLSFPTTLADNQSKQVSLLNAPAVQVDKELLISGDQAGFRQPRGGITEKLDVDAYLTLSNDQASGLGMPLPEGVVRIYKRDANGNTQFIGEDRIDHTPKNETLRLLLGTSFDVTAEKKQTEFKKRAGSGPWQYEFESAFEIEVRNAKPEPQRVTLRETLPGDWSMLSESMPHQKVDARTAQWVLEVPAEGKTRLIYRVRVRF